MRSRLLIVILAAACFLGGIGGGATAWVVFGPNTGPYDDARSVILPRGTTLDAAIDSLEAEGILESGATFRLVATATGWGAQLKPGHYRISSYTSNYRLLDTLRRGLQDPVRLTIPPGARPERVARVAGRRLELSRDSFRRALQDTSFARSLGTTPPHLFGYMLPNTYEFYWQTPPETVIRRVKEAFDRFYDTELAAGGDSLNLSKQELVTLASIVEWEAILDAEKPKIAGVYLNRLERGWRLQADPTVQYALIESEGTRTGRVLYEDLEMEHPYNTYQISGLPPGPITNPSPSSLRAVARPAQHRYFYFAATGDGGHTFSRTLREHNRAAEKYHEMLDRRERQQEQSDDE